MLLPLRYGRAEGKSQELRSSTICSRHLAITGTTSPSAQLSLDWTRRSAGGAGEEEREELNQLQFKP